MKTKSADELIREYYYIYKPLYKYNNNEKNISNIKTLFQKIKYFFIKK